MALSAQLFVAKLNKKGSTYAVWVRSPGMAMLLIDAQLKMKTSGEIEPLSRFTTRLMIEGLTRR